MKKIIYSFLLSISAISAPLFGAYEVVEDKSGLVIDTPALSKRMIRKLRLENGLEAILVSDPETHESGAALAVNVGSWDDPEERPGMAHFVEHLLFLGTEKYPEEEGYTRYLDEHGGSRNAFTMADRTVYMFSVNNDGFLGALDRFGHFFISPLFNPSGVDRESKAIHQEYCKDLPLDPWRMYYVKKELANKKHPFHTFCIGNSDTLKKITQEELKEWYYTHYSSNLMHLVVYSSLDVDTLEKEVVSLFSLVKNKERAPSFFSEPLFDKAQQPQLSVITPVQELQLLELSWEIPRFYGRDKKVHADKLLSHVLGHEGSTSLLAQLKRENLAEALGVGNMRAGGDQCILSLSVQLTSKGVKEYEKVIERCFEAIASLRQTGIPLYIFDEVAQMESFRYRFQSRKKIFDFVSDFAQEMIDEPLATYPKQTLIPSEHSPEKVNELIACLTPQNCHYALVAPDRLTNLKPTIKERWLGVGYTLLPIAPTKIAKWSKMDYHTAIAIPRPNPFLPSSLAVRNSERVTTSILPQPTLIADEPIGKIYAAEDTQFLVPEVCWTFTLKTPLMSDADPLSQVLADLYCHAVDESLKTTAYEALMAGLSYNLQPMHDAIELQIRGYSDKAGELLKRVLIALKETRVTSENFVLYKEQFAREYPNAVNSSPLKEGAEQLLSILYKDYAGFEEKSAALKNATYEKMQVFSSDLFKQSYIEGMFYGNMPIEEAKKLWQMTKKTLSIAKPFPPARHQKLELASLPSLEHPSYLVIPTKHPANALILTADCGTFSFKKRAAQEILTKGLEEPFFSELRTKQQTAYLVSNWSKEIERHLYNFFAIQSSSHDTRDLLARFELFIETSLQHLSEKVIPEERFESIRSAYIQQLKYPAENLQKMGSFLHTIAFQYDGDFAWIDKRIEAFAALTYEEFLKHAQSYLGKENTRRLAICINGSLEEGGKSIYRDMTTLEKIRSEICYGTREVHKQEEEEIAQE